MAVHGYSRWSVANATGEYVTAFGSDGRSVVYRLADRMLRRPASDQWWEALAVR